MKKFYFASLLIPTVLLAAGEGETDIVERTINFVIYIAILYYLAADKIKAIFVARQESIATELSKVQEKLKESKHAKEQAQKRVEESRRKAEEIVVSARKEASLLTQKIEESTRVEVESLIRHYQDSMEFEKRKREQSVVNEILSELFGSDATKLEKGAYAEILLKKVA